MLLSTVSNIVCLVLAALLTSPTSLAFYIHNDSLVPLTPSEWTQKYSCTVEQVAQNLAQCKRETTAWRFKYINEVSSGRFFGLVLDESLEQRLANLIYLKHLLVGFNHQVFKFDSGQVSQDEYNLNVGVVGGRVDDLRCKQHLTSMMEQIEAFNERLAKRRAHFRQANNETSKTNWKLEENELRLAKVLDSFGRYSTGFMSGRTLVWGSQQLCTETPLELNSEIVESRYCWAQVSLKRHLSKQLLERKSFVDEPPSTWLLPVGICLPSTCHSRSFEQNRHLIERILHSQFELPRSLYHNQKPPMDSLFCLVDDDSPRAQWSLGAKLFVAFSALWLSLTILATIVCYIHQDKGDSLSPFWLSLNVKRSWERFLEFDSATEQRRQPDQEKEAENEQQPKFNWDAINFAKVLASWTTAAGHAPLSALSNFANFVEMVPMIERSRIQMLYVLTLLPVQVYFVMTSLFITFFNLNALDKFSAKKNTKGATKSGPTNVERAQPMGLAKFWLTLAVARYARLVPLLCLMFWFKKYLYVHTSSGPLWDFGLNADTAQGACEAQSWWTPLAPLGLAYKPLRLQCLITTWSLAVDLIYTCCLLPPLVWLLHKWPRAALAILFACFVGSARATLQHYASLPAGFRWELENYNLHAAGLFLSAGSFMRTLPENNFAGFGVGTLAGYGLYRLQKSRDPTLPLWFSLIQATSCGLFGVIIVWQCFGDHVQRSSTPEDLAHFPKMFFIGNQLICSMACACLFVSLIANVQWRSNWLVRSLSGKFWKILAKLNYAVILIHWELMAHETNAAQTNVYYSTYQVLKTLVFNFSSSLFIAVFVFVLFESPFNRLLRVYLLRRNK